MSDKKKQEPSDAALQARLNQLELENRMRHRFNSISEGADPFKHTPRKGFGSAQGIAHLRHTEYQRRGPAPAPPAPMIPEPGKAKFGGTYLRTPLPGVLSGEGSNPWEELVTPVPARRAGDTDGSAGDPGRPTPPVENVSAEQHPRRRAGDTPAAEPEVSGVSAVERTPPGATLDSSGQKVIGGAGVPKAFLPPVYHAGMRAAAQGGPTEPSGRLAPEAPIAIPKDAEVRTDEPAKGPRVKKFKNPTLGPAPDKT